MSDRDQKNSGDNQSMTNERSGQEQGRQGNDKAPGEDPASGTENIIADTQKGKNKVDGDPSQPSDQPVDREF